MSQASVPTTSQYLNAANWTYSQAGTAYVDGPTSLPSGFTGYLKADGADLIDYSPLTGFYGAALVTTAGQVVIAIEGTNLFTNNDTFTAAQVFDLACITAGIGAPSYATALQFTQAVVAAAVSAGYSASNIFLTGHSMGGANVQYVSAHTGISGVTFGAPGIQSTSIPTTASGNLTDYVERGDPVGNYAQGGSIDIQLQSTGIVHYGTVSYIGSQSQTALLYSADAAYAVGLAATSQTAKAAALVTTATLMAQATSLYHPLGVYAGDLGVTIGSPGLAATAIDETKADSSVFQLGLNQSGTIDIPGLDISASGAVQLSATALTISADGQSYTVPLAGNSQAFSLQDDGQGGTRLIDGTARNGYVSAGSGAVTVQGNGSPLYFVGGTGAVSVEGGSGNTTLFGATSTATTVLDGGSGTNLLTGGAGATTLTGGTGPSTLIGGTGTTQEYAEGASPIVMVAGSGASTITGTTGTGTEAVFAGKGTTFIALNNAADTVIGGSGAASVLGGTAAPDVYGFINEYGGGNMIINGLKASDEIVFGKYGAHPITSEGVVKGSDVLTLTDGTVILLQGIDHKVFNGLA